MKPQWATKVFRHLAVKFDFQVPWIHVPLPTNNVDFSFFLDRPEPLYNIAL